MDTVPFNELEYQHVIFYKKIFHTFLKLWGSLWSCQNINNCNTWIRHNFMTCVLSFTCLNLFGILGATFCRFSDLKLPQILTCALTSRTFSGQYHKYNHKVMPDQFIRYSKWLMTVVPHSILMHTLQYVIQSQHSQTHSVKVLDLKLDFFLSLRCNIYCQNGKCACHYCLYLFHYLFWGLLTWLMWLEEYIIVK